MEAQGEVVDASRDAAIGLSSQRPAGSEILCQVPRGDAEEALIGAMVIVADAKRVAAWSANGVGGVLAGGGDGDLSRKNELQPPTWRAKCQIRWFRWT